MDSHSSLESAIFFLSELSMNGYLAVLTGAVRPSSALSSEQYRRIIHDSCQLCIRVEQSGGYYREREDVPGGDVEARKKRGARVQRDREERQDNHTAS